MQLLAMPWFGLGPLMRRMGFTSFREIIQAKCTQIRLN